MHKYNNTVNYKWLQHQRETSSKHRNEQHLWQIIHVIECNCSLFDKSVCVYLEISVVTAIETGPKTMVFSDIEP